MSQFETSPSQFGDPDLLGEHRSWPKVVGIISIVWASLGLICNGCTAIGPLIQPLIINMMPPNVQQQMQQQQQNLALSIGMAVLGVAMSALLLVAGIRTMRYDPKGRLLHIIWSAGSLVLGVIGGFVGYGQMKQNLAMQMQQMQSDPNTAAQAQKMQPMIETFGYLTFGCTMVFIMAWPIFVLIWFGLIKKRPEDMGPPPQELVA